jgi:hypothetical protein
VGAAIVRRQHFNVDVVKRAVDVLVFDPQIREMHLFVEVRQVVLACPAFDLMRLAIRATVDVWPIRVALVKPALVFAFEFVVQDDAFHLCAALGELVSFAQVRAIDLRVVLDLARLYEPGVERLMVIVMAVRTMRVQQVPATVCEHDNVVAMAIESMRSDQTLFAKVTQVTGSGIGRSSVVVPQVTGNHHAKRADGRQRACL